MQRDIIIKERKRFVVRQNGKSFVVYNVKGMLVRISKDEREVKDER